MLARLYGAMRLSVNFFQPSFKARLKGRDGAKVTKRYHPPATPCERLIPDARTSEEVRQRLGTLRATLDPVHLLQQIRAAQLVLVELADTPVTGDAVPPTAPTLEQFLSGLRAASQEGEVSPTSTPKPKAKRLRRRPDTFAAVTTMPREWFDAEPWRTSRELFERLQAEFPGMYPGGQPRTCQRGSRNGGERPLFDGIWHGAGRCYQPGKQERVHGYGIYYEGRRSWEFQRRAHEATGASR